MALSATEIQDQNRSEVPTQTVTNTGIGNIISKCCNTGQPLTIPQWSTLNEFYGILAQESLGVKNGRDFYLKYYGLGVRGSNTVGQDSRGVDIVKVNQHQPIDANLFVPIPLLGRTLDQDIDNITRANYRMRVVENIDGVDCVFYYLSVIDFTNYDPTQLLITRDPVTGEEKPVPFIPIKDSLFNPQPVDFTSTGNVPTSNTYQNSSAILGCSQTANMLAEIVNACLMKFKDTNYASISELGIAYGIDTQTSGQISQGATIQYTEVMSAIFAHYITERDGRNANNNTEIDMPIDHGASEPMLVYTNANASSTSS
jgi:hypothetical protein